MTIIVADGRHLLLLELREMKPLVGYFKNLKAGLDILRADSAQAEQLATREDETRSSATVLLLAASVASLLGVGSALRLAGRESGPRGSCSSAWPW
jgi:uncharacterized membrane protein